MVREERPEWLGLGLWSFIGKRNDTKDKADW